jgi:hypothetical protein
MFAHRLPSNALELIFSKDDVLALPIAIIAAKNDMRTLKWQLKWQIKWHF